MILETRAHYELHDLPDELQAELGPMLVEGAAGCLRDRRRRQRPRLPLGGGSENFHVWFIARPARIPQLIGSFAAIWDDVLPPLPDEVWQANLALIRDGLKSDSSQTRV